MKTFFFHAGFQPYLKTTIEQASRKNDVVLIGDNDNEHLGNLNNVRHIHINECYQDIEKFLKLYKHMHTGGQKFEEWCFIRWIAVRNAAKMMKCDDIFYGDSDNLIFSNLSDVYSAIGKPNLALAIPKKQPYFRQAATGEVSYWSLGMLDKFCNYLIEMYNDSFEFRKLLEKWNYHKNNNLPGGVCDMTALWHFTRRNKAMIITNLLPDGTSFDHSINNPANYYDDEYKFSNGVKEIEFIDNKPYGYNLRHDKKVRLHNLQFQGNSKILIDKYKRL
tara:strand:+ start:2559 stop:3386 length:828 start_codon:yes stop_codon:yes gene_type:complete